MKNIIFNGVATAIATPFRQNSVNSDELKKLLQFQISNKADAIVVCGTTGEAATMTLQEKIDTIKCTVDFCKGKIPIIAGTGSNNTKQAIEMSKIAERLGVDAILVVTPYYNKTTQLRFIRTL